MILKRQFPPRINSDPYYVKHEFETFVAQLLSKDRHFINSQGSSICTSMAETVPFDEQVVRVKKGLMSCEKDLINNLDIEFAAHAWSKVKSRRVRTNLLQRKKDE